MIASNDGRMRFEIQKWSCYYFSLVWWGWFKNNITVSAEMLNDSLYYLFQKKGWMTDTCFINRPDEILRWMGVNVKGVSKESIIYQPKKTDVVIGQWKFGDEMSHFVAMRDGHVVYDPWWSKEGGSKSVREGKLISYRIFPRG